MNQNQIVKTLDPNEKSIEYIPFGADSKIKLSLKIIQDFIAIPTRSGKQCSERDAMRFMMLCRARALNPFEGDAYLQGYDTKEGPCFSLITAHQAFLKRAEVNPEYDGMESGVILTVDGEIVEREGDFFVDQKETLVGGWARVHFKNRRVPCYRRLRLSSFKKPFGVWDNNPEGMIVKCAEADALRSAFPTKLGGMYLSDELAKIEEVEMPKRERVSVRSNQKSLPEPEPPTKQLLAWLDASAIPFETFAQWAKSEGHINEVCMAYEFPDEVAARLLRSKDGVLKKVQAFQEEAMATVERGQG